MFKKDNFPWLVASVLFLMSLISIVILIEVMRKYRAYREFFADNAVITVEQIKAQCGVQHSLEHIACIRNFVHQGSVVAAELSDFSLSGKECLALMSITPVPQYCGGMSQTFSYALANFGYPSRTIQLLAKDYLDGKASDMTHVTTEVNYQGEWFVSDPTFNTSFNCSDDIAPLGIADMRSCIEKFGTLTPFRTGATSDERSSQNYYAPYSDFLAASQIVEEYEHGVLVEASSNQSYPDRLWAILINKLNSVLS